MDAIRVETALQDLKIAMRLNKRLELCGRVCLLTG